MINYNIPKDEMPADVYANNPDLVNILTAYQTNNNILATGPYVPSAKPMEESTGGQSLNQMKA